MSGCALTAFSFALHIVRAVRVLAVEDELRMAALLKRGLQEDGYVVDIAATGTDAVWRAGEFGYDVVVLDLMLPGLDGVEVCRQLRKIGRWGPVLMLGAGLGLSIVLAIAQAHGGSAVAANRTRGGAVVTIELPVSHKTCVHRLPPRDGARTDVADPPHGTEDDPDGRRDGHLSRPRGVCHESGPDAGGRHPDRQADARSLCDQRFAARSRNDHPSR